MINQENSIINPYKLFQINDKILFKKKLFHNRLLSPKSSIKYSSISPNISKRMKQVTLSNLKYKSYLSRYDKITKENSFKTPDNSFYPKRKNLKYLPISNEFKKLLENKSNENIFKITNGFQNINNENCVKNLLDESINKKSIIEEKPYGFKYNDTRIITDRTKFKKILSNKNLINYSSSKIYKKLKINLLRNKDREFQLKNNNLFLSFSNGTFFENNNKISVEKNNDTELQQFRPYDFEYTGNENKEYNLNKEKNIAFLFKELKNFPIYKTNFFNDNLYKRKIEYNIQTHLKKHLNFSLEIKSIYIKFIEIKPKDNLKKINSQKIYFPCYYLPSFYLLDFSSFKCFISEIFIYNNEKNKFEININNDILKKYIKNSEIYYKNFDKLEEKSIIKIFKSIIYNSNESKYNTIYDWFIYNQNNNNYNKIYKIQIYFPIIKFKLNEERIRLIKYINKNLMVELLKKNFVNWHKYIIFDLFIFKKFRLIINNILSHKFESYRSKKIYLNRNNNQNYKSINYYNNNYECFITDVKSNITHLFNFVPITVILSSSFENRCIKTDFIQLSIKDTNNIKKLSKYIGMHNLLLKCLFFNHKTKEAKLNMNLIDNISDEYIKIVKKENFINKIEVNNKIDYNEIINYKYNNIDVSILLN